MEIERKVRLDTLTGIKDFIVLAGKYRCDVKVKARHSIVDGKSIMGIASLALYQPLTVVANGEDAQEFAGKLDQFQIKCQ
jgi:phosphotransferase system HPr-like phosphotransfer protein